MQNKKQTVYLIGIGMGHADLMTIEAQKKLEECQIIAGAKRMVAPYQNCGKKLIEEYVPEKMKEAFDQVTDWEIAVILFSGDTGFYSGAKKMKEVLETEDRMVKICPGISSIAYLSARIGKSWEDAKLLSIHGRTSNWLQAVLGSEKTFLLLGTDSGEEILNKIEEYDLGELVFYIGKNLSYDEEQILIRKGNELCVEDFCGLTTIMILNHHPQNRSIHLKDEAFIRGAVPMTKEEIRTVSIAKMELTEEAVVYDVGAGTGSVSIQMALQHSDAQIFAIERKKEAIELLKANRKKFYTDNVTIIEGEAPKALEELPVPTHVFIGGSGGNLKPILSQVREKNPDCKIVLNVIALETLQEVMEAIEEGILKDPDLVQMSVAKAKKIGRYHMMNGENPIYIIAD